jgi:hypothetical protein
VGSCGNATKVAEFTRTEVKLYAPLEIDALNIAGDLVVGGTSTHWGLETFYGALLACLILVDLFLLYRSTRHCKAPSTPPTHLKPPESSHSHLTTPKCELINAQGISGATTSTAPTLRAWPSRSRAPLRIALRSAPGRRLPAWASAPSRSAATVRWFVAKRDRRRGQAGEGEG